MIGKVKKWLGIEGVKLELVLPEAIQKEGQNLYGTIRFSSLHEQRISSFRVSMIEKYSRGRKDEQLIDEYELGTIELETDILVPENGTIEVKFTLPFQLSNSDMDEMASKNFLTGAVVSALKYFEGVKSEFRVEAEAKIAGVALSPFDRKNIELV